MNRQLEETYLLSGRHTSTVPLEQAIASRRSIRGFAKDPLSFPEISQLLWAAQGITDAEWETRSAPSAGATYPLEIYITLGDGCCEGLKEGIYHYRAPRHSVFFHDITDARDDLSAAAGEQDFIKDAPVVIVIFALYQRTAERYGSRAERYVQMEAGHTAQNIYLQAAALRLGTVAVGSFDDEGVREAMRVEKQLRPLYIMPVGRPC